MVLATSGRSTALATSSSGPGLRLRCRSPLSSCSPTGGSPTASHAHSHGLEAAVDAGRVHDTGSLAEYVTCRLWTTGRIDAAAARLAATGVDPDALDAAWCVRTPSAAARATSRSLGRSLARTAARVVPNLPIALADGRPPVQPVAFGLLATAVGCDPDEAALASAHGTAATLARPGCACSHSTRSTWPPSCPNCVPRSTAWPTPRSDSSTRRTCPHASTPFAEIDVELQSALPTRLFRS